MDAGGGLGGLDGGDDLELGELFAGQAREVGTLVEELDQGRLALEADAADEVVDVVAVEAAGGGQEDEVVAALDQVGGLDGLGVLVPVLIFGNELEVVVPEVEEAGGGAILRWGWSCGLRRRSGRRRGRRGRRRFRGSAGGRHP